MMRTSLLPSLLVACFLVTMDAQSARPRAREIGLSPGVFPPGPLNAITDVGGVKVGHVTLTEGDSIRTGVTAIVPHGGNVFQEKVAGAVFVGNAFGKLAGSTQIEELGTIETPIALTNTLSVGTVVEGLVRYTVAQPGNENVRSVNAVVGETNDGGLNDIRGLHVKVEHVLAAIKNASGRAVPEGSVGAGTGTRCYGWKGGIGTASRVLPERYGRYTLGVLVQTNFGGVLTIGGAPVGKELGRYSFSASTPGDEGAGPSTIRPRDPHEELGAGSCMIVVATDAPVDARDLKRIAARAVFGLGRTGSSYGNGSGDFAIAFTTSPELRQRFGDSKPRTRAILPPDGVSPLFQAALEATEEAVYNSLLQATTVKSREATAEAIPIDRVREILKKYGVIK
ncbi:MAG: P1 family peptidase [Acidobacteria bacterium]|nr:P1 family peptidase [Acidobacteriota bacterium]